MPGQIYVLKSITGDMDDDLNLFIPEGTPKSHLRI